MVFFDIRLVVVCIMIVAWGLLVSGFVVVCVIVYIFSLYRVIVMLLFEVKF